MPARVRSMMRERPPQPSQTACPTAFPLWQPQRPYPTPSCGACPGCAALGARAEPWAGRGRRRGALGGAPEGAALASLCPPYAATGSPATRVPRRAAWRASARPGGGPTEAGFPPRLGTTAAPAPRTAAARAA
ncbi:MAG: hypothetical protein HYZ72_02445 [Deltaproteobacteria bacterium]|nr:hypothetical protein [Deltaproteobacteria bacterium]